MKTAIIWNEIEDLKYVVVDGDYTHLHGVYINMADNDPDKERELSGLVYDEEFCFKHQPLLLDAFADAIRDGAALIECGFLP